MFPHRATVRLWASKWNSNGAAIVYKDNSRRFNAREVTNSGHSRLQHLAVGSNQRRVAREKKFSSLTGERVSVSKTTVAR